MQMIFINHFLRGHIFCLGIYLRLNIVFHFYAVKIVWFYSLS